MNWSGKALIRKFKGAAKGLQQVYTQAPFCLKGEQKENPIIKLRYGGKLSWFAKQVHANPGNLNGDSCL